VLDHEDGSVAGDVQEQLAGARGLLVGHPRHRLVHQEQLRVLGHDHADLEPLLLAMGEGSGAPPGLVGEPDALERRLDAGPLVAHPVAVEQRGEHALARPPQ
jgi:hypothetical protein